MKMTKIKSIQSTTDAMPNLLPFERHIEFLQSRGTVSQLKYLEVLKTHFKPENNGTIEKRFLERIEKMKNFDSWDKRIIALAFENSLLTYEIETHDKQINSLLKP